MRNMPSALTALGVLLILVGGLHREDMTSGAVAFTAFLILAVVTYPPADARRGHQAALILASATGVLALGLLVGELRTGVVWAQTMDDLLLLLGAGLVGADAASRLLSPQQARGASAWTEETDRTRRVSTPPRG